MPWGDGTGPNGLGSMTGRAAGYCAGYSTPGYLNPIPGRGYWGRGRGWGRGFGRGFGWGRGWRWSAPYYGYASGPAVPYNPPLSASQEADFLKNEAKALEQEMKAINDRIKTLERESKESKK